MRKQYHFRHSDRGLLAWDVDRLIKLTANFPRKHVPLTAIRELEEPFWFSDNDPPTCRAIMEHARLIDAADLKFPIILSSDGRVMDGMHRAAKAAMMGRTAIEAVQFCDDPDPDFIGMHPDELPYDEEPHPLMSDALTIRLLGVADTALLDGVASGVFDHDIDPRWLTEFLADPRHHLQVALLGGQVIGMASAVHYVHPDKPPQLWVNEVGVAPSHQGQGIGKQLMEALFAHGRTLGCSESWVLTEESNAAARRLYAAVGGKEKPAVLVSFQLTDHSGEPTSSSDVRK